MIRDQTHVQYCYKTTPPETSQAIHTVDDHPYTMSNIWSLRLNNELTVAGNSTIMIDANLPPNHQTLHLHSREIPTLNGAIYDTSCTVSSGYTVLGNSYNSNTWHAVSTGYEIVKYPRIHARESTRELARILEPLESLLC